MRKVLATTMATGTLVAALGGASPALAECVSQVNRFPAFKAVAPSATTVVIGTVVENLRGHDGAVATFRLQVDEILRGTSDATIDVIGLKSGLPARGNQACRANAFVYARIGDVLAIAFDGKRGDRTGVNTVAFIDGRPKAGKPGADILSRRQVYRATGVDGPQPDVMPPIGEQVAAIVAAVIAWLRLL